MVYLDQDEGVKLGDGPDTVLNFVLSNLSNKTVFKSPASELFFFFRVFSSFLSQLKKSF